MLGLHWKLNRSLNEFNEDCDFVILEDDPGTMLEALSHFTGRASDRFR